MIDHKYKCIFILVGAENPRFSNLGMNATPSTLTLNVFQNRSS